MNLYLRRSVFNERYTEGRLYEVLGGKPVYLCDTLEPPANRVCSCIPAGTYRVLYTYSPKFHDHRPLLSGVPYRSAIRIHEGNKPTQTKGCILVGTRAPQGGLLYNSRHSLRMLCERMEKVIRAGEECTITIEDIQKTKL